MTTEISVMYGSEKVKQEYMQLNSKIKSVAT